MKTYKSRISISLLVFIAVVCFSPVICVPVDNALKYIIVALVVFGVIVMFMTSIKYVIDGQILKIYFTYGIHTDIDIKSIKSIEKSHNILSSPAASLSRLAITYGKYGDLVLVSPRNQDDFIKTINEIRNA